MNEQQFDALTELARMKPESLIHAAARMVLLTGRSTNGAARDVGLTPSAVQVALNRIYNCQRLAREAVL